MIRVRLAELAVAAVTVSFLSSFMGNYRIGGYMAVLGMLAAGCGMFLERGRRGR